MNSLRENLEKLEAEYRKNKYAEIADGIAVALYNLPKEPFAVVTESECNEVGRDGLRALIYARLEASKPKPKRRYVLEPEGEPSADFQEGNYYEYQDCKGFFMASHHNKAFTKWQPLTLHTETLRNGEWVRGGT